MSKEQFGVEASVVGSSNAGFGNRGRKFDANETLPTVMASRPGQFEVEGPRFDDIASVTHPTEKRKLSIAELRRICGFPDDFILRGSYAQQWERLGNSVPPVMMFYIAKAIRDEVLSKAT